jgi:hypothetical protein
MVSLKSGVMDRPLELFQANQIAAIMNKMNVSRR